MIATVTWWLFDRFTIDIGGQYQPTSVAANANRTCRSEAFASIVICAERQGRLLGSEVLVDKRILTGTIDGPFRSTSFFFSERYSSTWPLNQPRICLYRKTADSFQRAISCAFLSTSAASSTCHSGADFRSPFLATRTR